MDRALHRRGNAEVATPGLACGAHRRDLERTLVLHDPANGRNAVVETRREGLGEHLERTHPVAPVAAIPELDPHANQAARGQFPPVTGPGGVDMSTFMQQHVDCPANLSETAMAIQITRRDLLNGMAIGAGGVLLPAYGFEPGVSPETSIGPGTPSTYYPPTLTGMRGSHVGSFEVAHALAWQGQKPASYKSLDEHYDLVIVGGGMSGLAAARYYQKKVGPEARILIIDNHDDFGGHAKRNEFNHKGRMLLSLGGAQNLDSPSNYGDVAGSFLIDIGIDEATIAQMAANTPDDYSLGGKLNGDVGLTVPDGDDHLTIGGHWFKFFHGRGDYEAAVRELPLPEDQQDKLLALFGGEKDFLDDLSLVNKWDYVNNTSYNQFLFDRVGLSRETIPILNAHLLILNGPSGWNHTVLEAIMAGSPGLRAMGWLADFVDSVAAMLIDDLAGDIRMFPDGNASVARLLVQKMIPDVAPGMKGVEDVAIARFDYGALDLADQPVRSR